MRTAALPANECERLAALARLGLLDSLPEAAFDDIVHLASLVCECPISLVSLVDKDRQWFKARHGLATSEMSRDLSFCAHAILTPGELFEIPDTLDDVRFHDHPLVAAGPQIRFYAGIPLMVAGGMPIGTLCVINRVPRHLAAVQVDALRRLARLVEAQVALRLLVSETSSLASAELQAQAALQASELRFRTMSEASPLGVFVTDAQGAALYLNPQWSVIAGMSNEQALGMGWAGSVHPEDRQQVTDEWYAAAREHRQFVSEYRFLHADGTVVWARGRAAEMCLAGDASEVIGFVGTVEDIGESKQLEVELRSARDEALTAMRSKADFLATMSHEIRTPMNGVIGMAGLLLDTDISGPQREYVEIIQQCSDALLVLINDILDFSKVDAGAMLLENTNFDPLQVLEEAAGLVAERAQSKGVDLLIRADSSLPAQVIGDPGRLRQILVNLLSNAVKFTERGQVEMVLTASPQRLQVQVTDSGIGMEPDVLQRLFKPFTQADASTSRRFGGTGLGLAICKRLVELMGGHISVTSNMGVGSTFAVDIPARSAAEISRSQVALQGAAIAVAKTLRSTLAPWINDWGGRVVDIGQPALASFVDNREPGHPCSNDPSLILVSGLVERLSDQQVSEADIAACLPRPLRLAAVIAVLNRLLGNLQQGGMEGFAHDRDLPQFGGRVLVADDNPVNVKVALALLQKIGIRADFSANGMEALAALGHIAYSLVLMDCQMPELDGLAATRELRRREAALQKLPVPVIALTANVMPGDRERCLAAGMDDYLAKPIQLEDLIAVVRRYLPPRVITKTLTTKTGLEDGMTTRVHSPVILDPPLAPDFDPQPLAQLLLDLNDPSGAILPELESGFREQASRQIAEINRRVAINELPQVALVAHALKGQVLTLGLMALADAATRLEHAAKAGDATLCLHIAIGLADLHERAQAALSKRIHG